MTLTNWLNSKNINNVEGLGDLRLAVNPNVVAVWCVAGAVTPSLALY